MQRLEARAIILRRIDHGEADRILTLLTPDAGKLSLIAKGVRRVKSKLAGGIELFSLSEISYIPGRGSVGTLVSSRLQTHYGNIAKDINRTMLGYELIKLLDKITEDEVEREYFDLLGQGFQLLNDDTVSIDFVSTWFSAQLLRLTGHTPNLITDVAGARLVVEQPYLFDVESVCFRSALEGQEGIVFAPTIKYLRLLFSDVPAPQFTGVENGAEHLSLVAPLVRLLRQTYLSV